MIRVISGTHGHASVEEYGGPGARRYTVRAAWVSDEVVIAVEGLRGQGVAAALAQLLADAPGPAAVMRALDPDAPPRAWRDDVKESTGARCASILAGTPR